MSVLVVGMSHRSAPVALLEKLSMGEAQREESLHRLIDQPALSEAMIVSTCNRLEVYAVASSFHTGVQDIVRVLHEVSGVDAEGMRDYLYVRYADAAAEHVLTVTSGLDSMVVGEQQIIGQIRTAYQAATKAGTVGATLHSLAQTALHTGKRVHSETAIDDAGASMVTVALEEALRCIPGHTLTGRRALVIGAGAMASLVASHLGRLGAAELVMTNRTRERAELLAAHSREAGVPARVVDFARRASALPEVDLVVSATGAEAYTVSASDVAGPTVLVDLSMPRDIDPATAELPGVSLVNIEALQEAHRAVGATDYDAASRIVAEELRSYTSQQRVRDVAPAVTALRRHAAQLITDELLRLRGKAPGIDEGEFDEVAASMKRVVDKLLHNPTVRAKQLALSSGVLPYDTALQDLFGLEHADESMKSVKVDASSLPPYDIHASYAGAVPNREIA